MALHSGATGHLATKSALSAFRKQARLLAPRPLARRVAASPPTITFTTTNALSSGRLWPSISSYNSGVNVALGGQMASVSRAAKPVILSASTFFNTFVKYTSVNYGSGTLSANVWCQSILHTGSRLVTWVKGQTGGLLAKVNGEYVSLTPQTVANDAGFYYWDFDFGSSATRRVDIIAYANVPFGGFYTGLGDSIVPAPLTGPLTAIMADSFGEGSGATLPMSWVNSFVDAMGWDNIIHNAVGQAGFLANNSGAKLNYRERYATDIAPLNPDVVIFQGSVNDDSYTPAQLATEALALIATAQAVNPNVLCAFTSRPMKAGVSASGSAPFLKRDAVKAAVEGAGHLFLDLIELPLPYGFVPNTSTLASSASASATTLSFSTAPLVGGTYAFADGSHVRVNSVSGTGPYTATLDSPLAAAQSNGAALTQVGACPWFGSGKEGSTDNSGSCDTLIYSDGTHPTQAGHDLIGELVASQLARQLKAL
jgi:lysophospholipase L1-like esterase